MKIIFTILFFGYNFSNADIQTPVNFRIEKRKGQFSSVMKTTAGTVTTSNKMKICVDNSTKPPDAPPMEVLCSMKIVIDTKKELKYETKCENTGPITSHSTWISEDVLQDVTIGPQFKMETKTTYDGPVCDKDAVRM